MKKMLFLLFVSIALSWHCQVVCAKSEGGEARPTAKKRRTLSPEQERMRAEVTRIREEKAKKSREQIEKMRKAKRAERDKARMPRELGAGTEKDLAAVEKKLNHETTKHSERMAKLHRMRELAQKKGSEDMVNRINRLVLKEGQRHDRKFQRMNAQKRGFMRGGAGPRKDPGAGVRPDKSGMRPPVNKRPYDLEGTGPRNQNEKKTATKPEK